MLVASPISMSPATSPHLPPTPQTSPATVRRVLLAGLLLIGLAAAAHLSRVASAQALPTADQLLASVERAQAGWRDVRAEVVGTFTGADGSNTVLEVEIQAIPAQRLSKILFVRPDSLADNFTVIDRDTVYNYLALTNQVVIQNLAQAAGGQGGQAFDLSNLAALIPEDRFERRVAGAETTPAGRAFRLEARALNPAADGFGRIVVWILDRTWRPHRLQVQDDRGGITLDLTVRSWRTGVGLEARRLRAFPVDAEIVDQRR